MLLFTADVNEWRDWFELTHQLTGGFGWVMWQRTSLPCDGGLEDQPAKLMAAMAVIAQEENARLHRQRRNTRTRPAANDE